MKKYMTTGEAAKMCGVCYRTVGLWVDKGLIEGFRIPFSKHRRVLKASIVKLMNGLHKEKKNGEH